MLARRPWIRALLPSVVTVGYVAISVLREDALQNRGGGEHVLTILGALLLAAWVGFASGALLKLAIWGFALSLVCALAPDRPLVLGAGFAGAAIALGAAGRAIAIAPSLGGLGAPRDRTRVSLALVPAAFALPCVLVAIAVAFRLEVPWPSSATPGVFAASGSSWITIPPTQPATRL